MWNSIVIVLGFSRTFLKRDVCDCTEKTKKPVKKKLPHKPMTSEDAGSNLIECNV